MKKVCSVYPRSRVILFSIFVLTAASVNAQVNVLTAHNDVARTGQNLNETILTPSNVNAAQFGKLFSHYEGGHEFGQPLYVSQVAIPGKGVHNVIYAATSVDGVFAFDAGTNGGIDASPLWKTSLLTNTTPTGTYTVQYGVAGTPVIDLTSDTMYLVSSENQGATSVSRLHALDITTGAEKFGGPVLVQASVSGTGTGSSAGVLTFDPLYEYQRPGLLLLNGVLYIAYGSYGDNGPWHGWLFSYNAGTLQQIDAFCTSANGSGGGIWEGGAGLAAEVYDPAKPYGRMFVATGNGSFSASSPFNNSMSYGMSMLDLDLANGKMTVEGEFTPYEYAALDAQDGDLGSGGPVLLPTQTVASGKTLNPLVEIGKSGMIYILDCDNNSDGSNNTATEYSPAGLGGFNTTADQVVQEVQTPQSGMQNWGAGVWGSEAYWNDNIYVGGTNPGVSNSLTAYSFINGGLSTTPTSQTAEQFYYPGPTPSVSANGASNGIVWVIQGVGYYTGTSALLAYDATNLANLLYSSNTNLSRDNPGQAAHFTVPTIANGNVYVGGAGGQLSVYGLLGSRPTVAPPVFSPPGATFTGSQTVTISDATPGAAIYYTTNGSTPSVSSNLYNGSITVTSSETITAMASATGYLQGAPVSASFYSTANAANPIFSLAGGAYSGSQGLAISDGSTGAVIYYTTDGTTPTTSSNIYKGVITVPVTETIQAMASAPGLLPSTVVSATYTISPPYMLNFSQGFSLSQSSGQMQFNGSTDLDDFRLQLTNGGLYEAGSAFYTQKVNIQSFTTDFTFQLSNPSADGITFTIQNNGLGALGGIGGGLGYLGIPNSVAIKFDLYNNEGEGPNSTGLYTDGAAPIIPAINLTGTGIDLHSGDYMNVHITYDGTNLNLTIADAITLVTWSHAFVVNIPTVVGGNTAYVGFTGGTGGLTSSQKVTYWTFLAGPPTVPNYPAGFDAAGLALHDAALSGTALQLTNGTVFHGATAYFSTPVDIESFTSNFDFTIKPASTPEPADGFTFVIQNAGLNVAGGGGAGLDYFGIPNSVAIKFDVYNAAGEGNDSTGLYVNGAMPTVPSYNLTSSGIKLSNGNVVHAQVTYDGTTLTWTLTQLDSPFTSTFSIPVTINIPTTIGSNTAYVGFTGASGAKTAYQNILDWTFTNP